MLLSSNNGQLCVLIKGSAINTIEIEIGKWHLRETGGILIGHYDINYRLATIEIASDAPSDSVHERSYFNRGIVGIDELLRHYKAKKPPMHYLGEWHTHPNNKPTASLTDLWQMNNFARRSLYGATSPLLLIVGGSLETNLEWQASIHKKWKKPIYLSSIN